MLCIFFGAYPFIPVVKSFVSFLLHGNKSAALELLHSDIIVKLGVNVFLTAILFTIPFIIAAKLLNYKISSLISFKSRKGSSVFLVILIVLGFFAVGDILSMIINMIFMAFGFSPSAPDFGTPSNIGELLFMLLTGAAAPALLEEFAFRGIVLNALRKFGVWPAIFVSSLFFGIMHGNSVQIPFAFCAGIGLGICYVKTNSLWACVLAHFLNNAFSFLISSVTAPQTVLGLSNMLFLIVMLFLGLIGLTLYLFKHDHFFKLKDAPSHFGSVTRTLLIVLPFVFAFAIYKFIHL